MDKRDHGDRADSGANAKSDSDLRALARQHTAKLLKMLRGYGPKEPLPAAETRTAVITELASVRALPAHSQSQAERELSAVQPFKTPSALEEEGKSTGVKPQEAAALKPAMVADPAPLYARRTEASPDQPLLLPVMPAHGPQRPVAPFSRGGTISSISEALHGTPGVLGQLLTQADRLAQSSKIFLAYLPPHLRDHAVLIRMDEKAWTVQTDSASWATRLRYKLYDIRQTLGEQLGITLPKPHIRVEPVKAPPPSQWPRLTLTKQSARLIERTAHNEPDPRLSAALLRLAQHTASDD